jgi:hypothetical protein
MADPVVSQKSAEAWDPDDERVARLWIAPVSAYSGIMHIHPLYLLLSALAHWLNREQAEIIDCLKTETRALRYTKEFRSILKAAKAGVIRTPPRGPNLVAYAELFARSTKEECLSRIFFFSEIQLLTAVSEYVEHYHEERNHQGLANKLIEQGGKRDTGTGTVVRDSRLGGLLNHYRKAARASSEFWDTTGTVKGWTCPSWFP